MTFFGMATAAMWILFSISLLMRFAHVLQAERYHTDAYLKWVWEGGGKKIYFRRDGDQWIHPVALVLTVILAGSFLTNFIVESVLAILAVFLNSRHLRPETGQKKPLVFTDRINRLLAVTGGVELFLILPLYLVRESYAVSAVVAVAYLQPFMLALGNVLCGPIEKRLQEKFKAMAREKLAGKKVIAVTGSYGKTGTKDALAHLLETKYPLVKSPGSFNTAMGLCKTVNDGMAPHHELFVAEMGATRPGDVKELCELVRPSVGIITSVGEAHLETFGSLEKVADTKFELADALPADGLLVYNADYPVARERAKGRPQKTVSYALEHPADYMPVNLRCSREGSLFDVKTPRGTVRDVRIKPLGKLHALNVTAAFAVGELLGVDPERMKSAAATLPQAQSRLELIENRGSYLVINDGFNSNPVGAAAAVETLGLFDGMKKILVTPGIVDLGGRHTEANFEFGKTAARYCDAVVLINERRTQPIADGLSAAGFKAENIKTVPSLSEARRWLAEHANENSVVLFENDLPDHMERF